MVRKTSGRGGRVRIARGLDEASLQWLAATVRPGSGARIELVFADGRRMRIARGANEADLRVLLAWVGPDSNACIELVFDGGADRHSEKEIPTQGTEEW